MLTISFSFSLIITTATPIRVRLPPNNIFKVIEFGKNKSKITLEINNIFYNSEFRDDIFIFNENDYLDYYIEKL